MIPQNYTGDAILDMTGMKRCGDCADGEGLRNKIVILHRTDQDSVSFSPCQGQALAGGWTGLRIRILEQHSSA